MIIGIDCRMLGPQCGGLGRYTEQLVRQLEELDTPDQYVLFLKKENWDVFIPKDEKKFVRVLADVHWYGWREQIYFLQILKKNPVDVMHFPHWNVPLFYNKPFVVTVHDLLLMHYPTREASTLGPLLYFVKQFLYKRVLFHAAKKAKHIFAPSLFTLLDIEKTLGIAKEKISVTYEAPFISLETPGDISVLQKKFDIEKPYALYVGVAYPHKNLLGLLDAWKIFLKKENGFQLVLVGKKNYFYKKVEAFIIEHRLEKTVKVIGFVTDTELQALYKNAQGYVFPSLYEGFGLPPLEAMTYGVPVLSSNRTCLPEILGESVLYADPENNEQFAAELQRLLTDTEARSELKRRMPQEIARYSWKKMAIETQSWYKKIFS